MNDRRLFPCNGRVAHESLKGQIRDVRFVPGELKQVIKPVAGLFAQAGGGMDRQMMYGAPFLELEQDKASGFSFGRAEQDGYVGYVETASLAQAGSVTHKVIRLNTHIYPQANMKTVPLMVLPLGACLDVTQIQGGFAELVTGGFVPEQAVAPIDTYTADPVAVAELFLGTAYLWGGDSYLGIDCSGLVQTALRACGQNCSRDSDMQQAEVGTEFGDNVALQRGDLVFWKGHVGIMVDADRLLHANAHHMRVTCEPLKKVSARILKTEGLEITCRRRP
jgi:cell wall-associated NlpC family hydrolase